MSFSEIKYKWIHLLIGILVLIAINFMFWPPNTNLVNHDIEYDPTQNLAPENMLKVLNANKSECILMGNSMLEKGVHPGYFEKLTGVKTGFIGIGASASAFWYLVIKNVICKLDYKPKRIAIFFRDHYLTEPSFRVGNEHKTRIDMLAGKNEETLDKKAYLSEMGDFEFLLRKNIPILQKQYEISTATTQAIKDFTANTFYGYPKGEADKTIARVFADENLDEELLSKYQINVETNKDVSKYVFIERYEKSFLPDIIQLAKANNIELIFVRIKRRRDIEPRKQEEELLNYISDLRKKLESEGVIMIDYTNDKRLTEAHYAAGDHLNKEPGMKLFTEMVADTLKPIISKDIHNTN